jgi:hypothetical protein
MSKRRPIIDEPYPDEAMGDDPHFDYEGAGKALEALAEGTEDDATDNGRQDEPPTVKLDDNLKPVRMPTLFEIDAELDMLNRRRRWLMRARRLISEQE